MNLFRKSEGQYGEDMAVAFLKEKNFTILERNFRLRNGEIDIIAIDNSEKEPVLVFIEVKTRMSRDFGLARESITNWKLQALMRTALFYQQYHPDTPALMRIDLVAIQLGENLKLENIELIKNIS